MVHTTKLLFKANSRWEMLALIKTLIEFQGKIICEGRTKNPIKIDHMEGKREGQKR
jgi:hypothetical protein